MHTHAHNFIDVWLKCRICGRPDHRPRVPNQNPELIFRRVALLQPSLCGCILHVLTQELRLYARLCKAHANAADNHYNHYDQRCASIGKTG